MAAHVEGIVHRDLKPSNLMVVDPDTPYEKIKVMDFGLAKLVSGPDVVGLKHLSMAIQTLTTLGTPRERLRVVLNRADSRVGITPTDVERIMRIKPDVLVPSSALVPTSLNHGIPVVVEEPRSGVARALENLASTLVAEARPTNGADPDGAAPRRRRLSRH